MKLICSILSQDFKFWLMHRRFFTRRLMPVIIMVLTVIYAWTDLDLQSIPAGLYFFKLSGTVLATYIFFTASLQGSTVFAKDRLQQTLSLLLISELGSKHLVTSRICSIMLSIFISLLTILPVLFYFHTLGGVSLILVASYFALMLFIACYAVAIGVCVAALIKDEKMAIFVSMLLAALLFGGAGLLFSEESAYLQEYTMLVNVLSPYNMIQQIFEVLNLQELMLHGFILALISVVLFIISSKYLPVSIHRQHSSLNQPTRSNRKKIKGNPVVWKEEFSMSFGLILFSSISSILVILPRAINEGKMLYYPSIGLFAATSLLIVLGLWVSGALLFSSEKELRTIQLLTLSELTEDEIILGKYIGVLKSFLPLLYINIIAIVGIACSAGFQTAAYLTLYVFTLGFAYYNLAVFLSLTVHRITALICIIISLIFWTCLSPILLMNLNDFTKLLISFEVFHLVAGIILMEMIFRQFRKLIYSESYNI
ncbi:MAG: hypothetical protein HRT89_14210 [Lentisphaeria bacterium]|nr:ABC transporter permease [Lentisphaeria bacterium]NQZ69210.1 hypothetical protein [Lentisphaeria bacterium]